MLFLSLGQLANRADQLEQMERQQRVRQQGAAQLSNALITNNLEAVMQILHTYRDDSLDVDYVEPRLGHPLCALAALSGKASIALLLLQRGANPMARNMNGRTVLYIAVECGLEDMVRCITDGHPELDLNTPATSEMQQYCPIHVAARYNHGHIVRMLAAIPQVNLNILEKERGYAPLTLGTLSTTAPSS